MSAQEIENRFASAGWHLDGGFTGHLVIGYSDDGLSILARKEAWETDDEDGLSIETYKEAREMDDDPVFELIDHERNLTYRVWEIPTPEEAREMLKKNGLSPAEERD